MNTTCDVCRSKDQLKPVYNDIYDDRYGHPGIYSVARCHNCGTFSTTPPLTTSEIGPLYTNYYPRQIINLETVKSRGNRPETPSQMRSYWWNGNHKIQHMLPIQGHGERVLDVGCGDGASLIELKRRGYDAYGIETDENISLVRDSFKLPIHIGTIENCPFPKSSFDIIMANQVIEHIIDLDSFISAIRSFLKPGGIAIVSTPNSSSVYRALFGKKWAHWHIPYHQHILNKKGLRIILEKHGFNVKSHRTVSPTTWMIHTLNRLRHTPVRGTKNPLWAYDQKQATKDSAPKKLNISRLSVKRITYNTVLALISFCNRIVDMFGCGDCIVVTAKRN